MNNKVKLLLVLFIGFVLQLSAFWVTKDNFETVVEKGTEYRVTAELKPDTKDDRLRVYIRDMDARWLDVDKPKHGEKVYYAIARGKDGEMILKGASLKIPPQGDYLVAHSGYLDDKDIPHIYRAWMNYNFYMDPRHLESLPIDEYTMLVPAVKEGEDEEDVTTELEEDVDTLKEKEMVPKHKIIAVLKVYEGDAVVTDVLVDDHSLNDLYYTEAAEPAPTEPATPEEAAAERNEENERNA